MSLFNSILGSRHDVPVLLPAGFNQSGPSQDAEASHAFDPSLSMSDIEGVALALEYEDAACAPSRRVVLCDLLDPTMPGYLRGFCQLRLATRTFRVDRIRSLTNLTTGEVVERLEVLAYFSPYMQLAKRTAERQTASDLTAMRTSTILRAAAPAVKLLTFLAMADGHLHPAEREVALGYVDKIAALMPGSGDFDRGAVSTWIDSLRPTRAVARAAVLRLSEDLTTFPIVARAMLDLVQADGIVDPAEDAIVRSLIKAIRKAHLLPREISKERPPER